MNNIYKEMAKKLFIGILLSICLICVRGYAASSSYSSAAAQNPFQHMDTDLEGYTHHRTGIADPKTDTGFKQLMSTTVDDRKGLVAASMLNSFIPDFGKDPVIEVNEMPLAIPALREEGERQVFMDFHVRTNKGEHVIVEMQVKRHVFFDERALFYTAYTFSHQFEAEKLKNPFWYTQIKKTYSLQFLNYDSDRAKPLKGAVVDTFPARVAEHPMNPGVFIKHYMMTDKFSGQTIDTMQMIQIELARITRTSFLFPPSANQQIPITNWWLALLKSPEMFTPDFIASMKKQNSPVPSVIIAGLDRLNFAKWRPELVTMYEQEDIDKRKYALEFASERLEGRQQGKYETALKSWIDVFIGTERNIDPSTMLTVVFPPVTRDYVTQAWGERDPKKLKLFLELLHEKGLLRASDSEDGSFSSGSMIFSAAFPALSAAGDGSLDIESPAEGGDSYSFAVPSSSFVSQ